MLSAIEMIHDSLLRYINSIFTFTFTFTATLQIDWWQYALCATCIARKETGQQTWFMHRFKLLIKSFNSEMLDVWAVVVADGLARSPVELLLLERRRQRPWRRVNDRRILALTHYSLRHHVDTEPSQSVLFTTLFTETVAKTKKKKIGH